ncbi:MAG: hypothetical protein U0992_22560 [Planctomycetaceae bacterium]
MLSRLIEVCLENRFLVLALTALMAVAGICCRRTAYRRDSRYDERAGDGDHQPVRVVAGGSRAVHHVSGGIPMNGLPRVEQIRSVSKFGISVVTIVFVEGTDIYRGRGRLWPNVCRPLRP